MKVKSVVVSRMFINDKNINWWIW